MDFFDAVKARRSIRRFLPEPVPKEVMARAFEAATLAPNSSNTQTWDFFWVKSPEKKQRLVEACMNQSAARTAQELVVFTADPKNWKRSLPHLQKWVETAQAPKPVVFYYQKLIPTVYRWGFLNSIGLLKWILMSVGGLFRPMQRGVFTLGDQQVVAVKSAALAAENFVLAMSAQGYSTCMMEGFDEVRVKRLLGLRYSARVVMVVGLGKAAERSTWGPQYRLPQEMVVHEI
jgi:nitroreductase